MKILPDLHILNTSTTYSLHKPQGFAIETKMLHFIIRSLFSVVFPGYKFGSAGKYNSIVSSSCEVRHAPQDSFAPEVI